MENVWYQTSTYNSWNLDTKYIACKIVFNVKQYPHQYCISLPFNKGGGYIPLINCRTFDDAKLSALDLIKQEYEAVLKETKDPT